MLEPLGPHLWFADGGIVSFNGFDYPTRMAIVRLADGGLWLWSPVEKTVAIEDEVRALGPVSAHRQSQQASLSVSRRVAGRLPKRETLGDCGDNRQMPAISISAGHLPTGLRPIGKGRSTNSISPIHLS